MSRAFVLKSWLGTTRGRWIPLLFVRHICPCPLDPTKVQQRMGKRTGDRCVRRYDNGRGRSYVISQSLGPECSAWVRVERR